MRLVITTPAAIVLDVAQVVSVRAEDPTGWFGVRPGHADLLTVLVPSVMSWTDGDGVVGLAAVRGGVLTVRGGDAVEVATREAFLGTNIDTLADELAASIAAERDSRAEAHTGLAHLEVTAIRHLQRYLDATRGGQ